MVTGSFGKRCISVRDREEPSYEPMIPRPLDAPKSIASMDKFDIIRYPFKFLVLYGRFACKNRRKGIFVPQNTCLQIHASAADEMTRAQRKPETRFCRRHAFIRFAVPVIYKSVYCNFSTVTFLVSSAAWASL